MTISRRTFVKAVSALAVSTIAPAWVQFKQQREINLLPFCERDIHPRYDLRKPFAQGGVVIATDGRVLVRTTLADAPELNEERKLPNVAAIPFWNQEIKSPWKKWPRVRYVGTKNRYGYECPRCIGIGGFGNVRECEPCIGTGYVPVFTAAECAEFDSYEKPCKDCNHSGWLFDVKCEACGGTGDSKAECYQLLEGEVIASIFDAKLRQLGELEYQFIPVENEKKNYVDRIIKFRGDGFDGFLMPMDVKHCEVQA